MESLAIILIAANLIVIAYRFIPRPATVLMALAFVGASHAQETNVHASIGTNRTVGAGVDYRFGKNLVTGGGSFAPICKHPGGCGHQYDFRGVYARKVYKNLSLQGGFVNSYYKVPLFSKNAFQALVGVRFSAAKERFVGEVNYRHDLTSNNKLRIVEARATGYLPYHIFVRAGAVADRFVSSGQSFSGNGTFASIGVYF